MSEKIRHEIYGWIIIIGAVVFCYRQCGDDQQSQPVRYEEVRPIEPQNIKADPTREVAKYDWNKKCYIYKDEPKDVNEDEEEEEYMENGDYNEDY